MTQRFPAGFIIEHDGQSYAPVQVRDYITKTGEVSAVIEWATECPTCGKGFVMTTAMRFRVPRRRCDDCKAPGRRVQTDRKRFIAQISGDRP